MNTKGLVQRLLPTLYEDDALLALSKPAGVDVGGLKDQTAAGLLELLPAIRPKGERLFAVNRLSRYESGVLLLAKDADVSRRLRDALKAMRIRQTYAAVVLGRMSKPRMVIDPGRGSSRGRPRSGRFDGARRRRRMPPANAASAGEARTGLQVVREGPRRSLIRCQTTLPTTHGLRAQLRSVRLRLLGDRVHDPSSRLAAHSDTCLHLTHAQFDHPQAKKKVTVKSAPPEGFAAALEGERDVRRALHAALTRRLPCLVERDTDSYRLLTGPVEDVPGVVAEKYGDVVVLQVLEDRPTVVGSLPVIAKWYRDVLHLRAVYAKRFVKQREQIDEAVAKSLYDAKPLVGERAAPEIEILERGLRFAIRPYEGFSVGLFLDHRDNRTRVREMAAGYEVLNLFAYTCGFSVAAAAGGAKSTVSVDLSPKHLEWGRTNFALNGVALENHQFIRSGAMDYLKRAKRQGKRFDLILLDPPSFAHGRQAKQRFSILTDLPALVAAALEVLRPRGTMMIAANHRKMSLRNLRERIHAGAAGRPYRVMATPPLPPDFAMDRDHAKTQYVQFDEPKPDATDGEPG